MAKLGYIQVTRECNQTCLFCSNPPSGEKKTLHQLTDLVDKLITDGHEGVILTGGEPTLFKELPQLVKYCIAHGTIPRIITNCQKLSEYSYFEELYQSGLRHIHTSIYSHLDHVHDHITGNKGSLQRIFTTLAYLQQHPDITINMNTVLNAISIEHIHESLDYLTDKYPFMKHIVVNNMDPLFNRVADNPEVIPSVKDIEIAVHRIGLVLTKKGISFRIERVPICLMTEYAQVSTETRKLVKEEERTVYFLDQREKVTQTDWEYDKNQMCKLCSCNAICAGMYAGEQQLFDMSILTPLFIDPDSIRKKVK